MQQKRLLPMLMIALLVAASAVFAQSDPLSGKYKGVAKSEAMGDLPLEVTIKNTGGKLSGVISTAQGDAQITGGTFENNKIKLTFDAGGTPGTVDAEFKDGKIVGKWDLSGMGGPLELTREGGAAAAPAASAAPAAGGAVMVGGDWDASADVMGQALPFTLKLKQEGETVTGESVSDQGAMPITKGKLAGNLLSFSLETPNGEIKFTAKINGNMIDGEYDFAGQAQGKWTAKKK